MQERSPGPSWSPLAHGESAAAALAAVKAIASEIGKHATIVGPGLGLSGGQSGWALFFDYLDRATGHAEACERAQLHLDRAIADLAQSRHVDASLYHGFAGVAWAAEHLMAGAISEEDEDPNAEIDEALLSILQRGPWRGEFDLLGGLIGWGVYALDRLPRPSAAAILALVVTRLAECGEWTGHGLVWRDPRHPEREPDTGMAHGAAGAIALLARILQEGAPRQEAAELLTAAVQGVLDSAHDDRASEGELAWCSGDVGLSVALLAAADAASRHDWEEIGRRLAARAAARFPDGAEGFDPALCHGTAGLCHLFHRLYLATGDESLLSAAHRWLGRTLAHRRPGQGIGGFLCRRRQADGQFGWISDPGLLGGSAGIGLALLAAITPGEPAWDRLLLLSGRSR